MNVHWASGFHPLWTIPIAVLVASSKSSTGKPRALLAVSSGSSSSSDRDRMKSFAYIALPIPVIIPLENSSIPSCARLTVDSNVISQSVSQVPRMRWRLLSISRWLTLKLVIYTGSFLQSARQGDALLSGRLSIATTARPHCGHVLTLILVSPSSKKMTLCSGMLKPNHDSPRAKLLSYYVPHASETYGILICSIVVSCCLIFAPKVSSPSLRLRMSLP